MLQLLKREESRSQRDIKKTIQNIFLCIFFSHIRLHSVFEGVESNDKHLTGGLKKFLMSSVFVPMTLLVVPPGQPTVERHGPLFPALETNITLCFCTASVITSQILLKRQIDKNQ